MKVKTLLFLLGLSFIILALAGLAGCYSATDRPSSTEAPAKKGYLSDQDAAREKYDFDMVYFDWRGVYLIKLQGHEYLRAGDFILHTSSCPGVHTLVSP